MGVALAVVVVVVDDDDVVVGKDEKVLDLVKLAVDLEAPPARTERTGIRDMVSTTLVRMLG